MLTLFKVRLKLTRGRVGIQTLCYSSSQKHSNVAARRDELLSGCNSAGRVPDFYSGSQRFEASQPDQVQVNIELCGPYSREVKTA